MSPGSGAPARALADQPDQLGGRILHGADEHRQAQLALADQRAVVAVVDAVRSGRRPRRSPARRPRARRRCPSRCRPAAGCLDDRQRDGIDGAHASAPPDGDAQVADRRRPWPRSPGSITVVASICSTIAGPRSARRAAASSRSNTGAVCQRPSKQPAARRSRRPAAWRRGRPGRSARRSGNAGRRPITEVSRLTSTGPDLRQPHLEAREIGRLEQRLHRLARDIGATAAPRGSGASGRGTACRRRAARWSRRSRSAPRRSCAMPRSRCAVEDRVHLAPCRAPSSGTLRVLTKSWRRSATTQPSALVMPGRAGTSTSGMPSSRASATACSGPAPPKANSAKSRGSWPRASDTMRMAPAICVLPSRITAAAAASTLDARAAVPILSLEDLAHVRRRVTGRVDRQQPLRVEPAEHQIGVGDGRLACRRGRSRSGPARRRPTPGRPASMPAASMRAIEPPPAPTVLHVHHRHVDRQGVVDGRSRWTPAARRRGSAPRRSRCRPCRR